MQTLIRLLRSSLIRVYTVCQYFQKRSDERKNGTGQSWKMDMSISEVWAINISSKYGKWKQASEITYKILFRSSSPLQKKPPQYQQNIAQQLGWARIKPKLSQRKIAVLFQVHILTYMHKSSRCHSKCIKEEKRVVYEKCGPKSL